MASRAYGDLLSPQVLAARRARAAAERTEGTGAEAFLGYELEPGVIAAPSAAASLEAAPSAVEPPTPAPARPPARRRSAGGRRPGPRRRLPDRYDQAGWVTATTTLTPALYDRLHAYALTEGGGRHDKSRLVREALEEWLILVWEAADAAARAGIVAASHSPEPGRVHRNYELSPELARRLRVIDSDTGMSSASILRAAIRWRFGR